MKKCLSVLVLFLPRGRSLALIFIILFIFHFNCSKKNNADLLNQQTEHAMAIAGTICGSGNQSLQWLKEIISKAEEDKLTKKYDGNYMGKIITTSYQNQPIFYITMALGSGGIFAYTYDCNGKNVLISSDDLTAFEQNAQKGKLIYSNVH